MEDRNKRSDAFLNAVRDSRPAIVVLDERWHQMFEGIDKPKLVRELEKEVDELLKKQGQTNTDLKEVKKVKAKLMDTIVANMDTATGNDGENKKRARILEKNEKLIRECNEKLEKLENDSYEIPIKLKEANEKLIVASMEIAYINLQIGRKKYAQTSEWIEKARAELRKQLIIKQDLEEQNERIYTNMHDILGPRLMELLDNKYGEKE